MEPEEALDRAAAVLADAPSVALAGHVNPDPDAIGSMLGLAASLQTRGAEVVCSWPNEPLARPAWLEVLDEVPPIVRPAEFPRAPAVMVALDTASSDRLASLEANASRAGTLIVLDHHATNPGFGHVLVLDPAASSTAEITFRLIERMGIPLTPAAAAALYAGVVTDTGRFQYQAVRPETLRLAAELRTHTFDHARLAQLLFEDNSFRYLRLMAVALERLTLVPEARLVWTHLRAVDLVASGVSITETDDLIDVIRTAREADVACVFKEQQGGKLKASLRSRGATDVGAIAQAFGGGGHRLAAGYTSALGLEGSVAALVAAIRGAEVPA